MIADVPVSGSEMTCETEKVASSKKALTEGTIWFLSFFDFIGFAVDSHFKALLQLQHAQYRQIIVHPLTAPKAFTDLGRDLYT